MRSYITFASAIRPSLCLEMAVSSIGSGEFMAILSGHGPLPGGRIRHGGSADGWLRGVYNPARNPKSRWTPQLRTTEAGLEARSLEPPCADPRKLKTPGGAG